MVVKESTAPSGPVWPADTLFGPVFAVTLVGGPLSVLIEADVIAPPDCVVSTDEGESELLALS